MGISFGELIIIAVVVSIFVSPEDISKIASSVGQFMKQAATMGAEFLNELKEPVQDAVDMVKEDLDESEEK